MKKLLLSLATLALTGSFLPVLTSATTFAVENPDQGYIIAPGLEIKNCKTSETQIRCKIFGENPKNQELNLQLEYQRGEKILDPLTTEFRLLEKGIQPKENGYELFITIGDWHDNIVLTFSTEGLSKTSISLDKNGDILEYTSNIHPQKKTGEIEIKKLKLRIKELEENCDCD